MGSQASPSTYRPPFLLYNPHALHAYACIISVHMNLIAVMPHGVGTRNFSLWLAFFIYCMSSRLILLQHLSYFIHCRAESCVIIYTLYTRLNYAPPHSCTRTHVRVRTHMYYMWDPIMLHHLCILYARPYHIPHSTVCIQCKNLSYPVLHIYNTLGMHCVPWISSLYVRLNHALCYVSIALGLSTCPSMDSWVDSTLGILWCMFLLW